MKAVILAGGFGTRIRSRVSDMPKPMARFNGKPLLEYLVEQLSKHFTEIIMLVGYKAEQIINYFGDGAKWGVKIKYSIEKEPMDTGGAIKLAKELINDDFVLLNGDNYHELDYELLKKQKENTMIVTKAINPTQVTIVKIKDGIITGLKERPSNPEPDDNLMNAGVLVLKKEVLDLIPDGKSHFETTTLPLLIKKGMKAIEYNGYYIDIGTPSNYDKFVEYSKKLIK